MVVGDREVNIVAAAVFVVYAVIAVEHHDGRRPLGKTYEALLEVMVSVEHIIPHATKFQILPLAAETALDVETQGTIEHGEAGVGAVAVAIVHRVGTIVPLFAISDHSVVVVALQQIEAVDV